MTPVERVRVARGERGVWVEVEPLALVVETREGRRAMGLDGAPLPLETVEAWLAGEADPTQENVL